MIAAPFAALTSRHRSGNSCTENGGFCPQWIFDHFERYLTPLWQHFYLTVLAVLFGLIIALGLALAAQRFRWLTAPTVAATGAVYTIPSIAMIFLLQPITGRGSVTALIALTLYTLLILFRNIIAGLNGVPEQIIEAGRGVGLSDQQLLWKIKLPLAVPEIFAGLRIACTSTVGLATLAFFAGAGGLGEQIFADLLFKSNVVIAGGLCVLLALALDISLLAVQRPLTRWRSIAR